MENRQQQILSEIKTLASSVRSQMEALESKVAELQQIIENEGVVEPSDVVASSGDIEIDVMDIELSPDTEFYSEPLSAEPEPETLSVEEEPAVGPEVISDEPAVEPEVISQEVAVETAAEPSSEQVAVVTPEEVDDDLPFFEDMPAEPAPAILNDVQPSSDEFFGLS